MQQTQQREQSERISWARAMIFAVGFFFITALLIGQIPGFIFIQVVVMLFDPKPVVPPIIFSVIGFPVAVAGLALLLWAAMTGHQYFPAANTNLWAVLGGKFLWFPVNVIDFVMIGSTIMGIGLAMVFF